MRSSAYYLGIDLGASNIRSVIARDEQPIPRILVREIGRAHV